MDAHHHVRLILVPLDVVQLVRIRAVLIVKIIALPDVMDALHLALVTVRIVVIVRVLRILLQYLVNKKYRPER